MAVVLVNFVRFCSLYLLVCSSNKIRKGELVFVKEPSLMAANYKDVKYTVGRHILLIDCPSTSSFPESAYVCLIGLTHDTKMLNSQHMACRQVVSGWHPFYKISGGTGHRGLGRHIDWIALVNITSEEANSFASENYWKNWRFKHELFMACPCLGRDWEPAQIHVPIDHSK